MDRFFKNHFSRLRLKGPLAPILIWRYILIFLIFYGCLWPAPGLPAVSTTSEENTLKAAFVYNFIKFIEWPSEVFENPESPLNVYVLGENQFIQAVTGLEGKRVKQRKLIIRRLDPLKIPPKMHVLVVSGSAGKDLRSAIPYRIPGAVLTISDQEGFAEKGGMIELFQMEDKIRFDVNLIPAGKSSLKFSSQLLKLARRIIE